MSARLWGLAALLCAAGMAGAAPVLIDHRDVDVTRLTLPQIERAKAALHIAYGHTSHGSQLTDGMSGLVGFANGGGRGLALPANVFAWNNGGSGGALDLHDYALCNDVGYYPDWVVCTSNYLDDPANADVNVVIWSWCGQMDDKYAAGTLTNEYLRPDGCIRAELSARGVRLHDRPRGHLGRCGQQGRVRGDPRVVRHERPDPLRFQRHRASRSGRDVLRVRGR